MWEGTVSNLVKVVFLLMLWSCTPNYRNVELTGVVFDNANGKVIPNAKVKIVWWTYDTNKTAWESVETIDTTKTDSQGRFTAQISKAEAYDIYIYTMKGDTAVYGDRLRSTRADVVIEL